MIYHPKNIRNWFGIPDHSFLLKVFNDDVYSRPSIQQKYFIMIFPLCTYTMAIWWSIVTKVIIGVGPSGTTH